MSADFTSLKEITDTRFYAEFIRLGKFIEDYVLSGKLSALYEEELQQTS